MSGGSIHSGPNYQTNVKTVLGKEQAATSSHSTPSVGIKQNEGQVNIIGSQSQPVRYRGGFNSNGPLTKTQWRRMQRNRKMIRDITQGNYGHRHMFPSLSKEGDRKQAKIRPRVEFEDDEYALAEDFESGFADSLEDICGVVSVLPEEYANEYEEILQGEDYEEEDEAVIDKESKMTKLVSGMGLKRKQQSSQEFLHTLGTI